MRVSPLPESQDERESSEGRQDKFTPNFVGSESPPVDPLAQTVSSISIPTYDQHSSPAIPHIIVDYPHDNPPISPFPVWPCYSPPTAEFAPIFRPQWSGLLSPPAWPGTILPIPQTGGSTAR